MLSRTVSIEGFYLKSSRTEKELYEGFLENQEAEIRRRFSYSYIALRTGTRGDDPVLAMKLSPDNDVRIRFRLAVNEGEQVKPV